MSLRPRHDSAVIAPALGVFGAIVASVVGIAHAQVAVTPAPLPQPHIGQAYNVSLAGSGGVAPYTFVVTAGPLPPGVTMSTAGAFAGVPASQIPFAFTVVAADALGREAVLTSAGVVGGFALALAQPPDPGKPGQSYNETLVAAGGVGPYTWTLVSGTLPPGLTLNPDGSITGTPTATGTFVFVVHVVDSDGTFADITVALRIGDPLPVPATGPAGLALLSFAIGLAAWWRRRRGSTG